MQEHLDGARLKTFVDEHFESALGPLAEYVRVPCLSPAFDEDWADRGELRRAARLLAEWAAARAVPGLVVDLVELPGRTPVVLAEAPGSQSSAPTVLVYGHLDKQPPLGEWAPGLGPFEPVRRGDRLYGRGTGDDGYAVFAALLALEATAALGAGRPRVVVLIEGSEESGSPDLEAYLDKLAPHLERPVLVVCLDSGCLTWDRLWVTTSLRGALLCDLRVEVLTEGVHSGLAGGVVPSSFRLLRQLLSRVEDERTGELLLPELHVPLPEAERRRIEDLADEFGEADDLPVVPGLVLPAPADRLRRKAWEPALAVTGIDGVPSTGQAGNVLRPFTTVRLSVRIPPGCDAAAAGRALVDALTHDPPEGARVTAQLAAPADGWLAPEPAPFVTAALDAASLAAFDRPAMSYGEGGTIPFLAALGRRFPGVQLVATGVLGPESNAHGPNEFLHVPMAKAVTAATAQLLVAAAGQG